MAERGKDGDNGPAVNFVTTGEHVEIVGRRHCLRRLPIRTHRLQETNRRVAHNLKGERRDQG